MTPSSRSSPSRRLGFYDLICAALAPVAAYALRDMQYFGPEFIKLTLVYTVISCLTTVAMLTSFRVGSALSRYFMNVDVLPILRACFLSAALPALAIFIFTRLENVPRSLPVIHFIVLSAAILGGRFAAQKYFSDAGIGASDAVPATDNIIVFGANRLTFYYIRIIDNLTNGLQKVVGILDANPRFRDRTICNCKVLGGPKDLEHVVLEYEAHGISISKIVIAEDYAYQPPDNWDEIEAFCARRSIGIVRLAERLGIAAGPGAKADKASALLAREAATAAVEARSYWRLRRVLDPVAAAAALIALAPLIALVACLVMADVGRPIVFWQRRLGRKQRPISVYKFRTLNLPIGKDGKLASETERLSAIGRLLRASRLDELPQLFNVLTGDMAIVGPRPLLPADQPPDPGLRLAVTPGVTGWAQVYGGRLVTSEEKNALDEYYVRNASFALDCKIIGLTFATLFLGDRRNDDVLLQAAEEKPARGAAGWRG